MTVISCKQLTPALSSDFPDTKGLSFNGSSALKGTGSLSMRLAMRLNGVVLMFYFSRRDTYYVGRMRFVSRFTNGG